LPETCLSDGGITTADRGGTVPEFIATFMACQHDHRTSIAG
jgi:hypothetical protein